MRIAGSLEVDPEFQERRAERFHSDIAAVVRERGRSVMPIEVVDLSTHGCRIEFSGVLVVGAQAWVSLPDLDSRHARVAWMGEGEAGLDFMQPLHPGIARLLVG